MHSAAAVVPLLRPAGQDLPDCPYKIAQDNNFRAATEFHVFVVIVVALVLEQTDVGRELSRETLTSQFYDWTLFFSWLAPLPVLG